MRNVTYFQSCAFSFKISSDRITKTIGTNIVSSFTTVTKSRVAPLRSTYGVETGMALSNIAARAVPITDGQIRKWFAHYSVEEWQRI
jgi:hypothetical protein